MNTRSLKKMLCALALPCAMLAAGSAHAQATTVCGPEVKEEAAIRAMVCEKFKGCAADGQNHLDTVQPMDGATRNARSILSWDLPPTSCDCKPVRGSMLEYTIRLDQ